MSGETTTNYPSDFITQYAVTTPEQKDCADAVAIRNHTEDLLLGCVICPELDSSASTGYNTGARTDGIVSSRMKCAPKGAFCYSSDTENKCDNAAAFQIDLDILEEMTVDLKLSYYIQKISNDPRFCRTFTNDQVNAISEQLVLLSAGLDAGAADGGWSAALIFQLQPLLDALNVAYGLPDTTAAPGTTSNPTTSAPADANECPYTNECGQLNFEQLSSALDVRFKIMSKFALRFNTSNSKEAHGRVKQQVNISWDFCNAPVIKGCCGSK